MNTPPTQPILSVSESNLLEPSGSTTKGTFDGRPVCILFNPLVDPKKSILPYPPNAQTNRLTMTFQLIERITKENALFLPEDTRSQLRHVQRVVHQHIETVSQSKFGTIPIISQLLRKIFNYFAFRKIDTQFKQTEGLVRKSVIASAKNIQTPEDAIKLLSLANDIGGDELIDALVKTPAFRQKGPFNIVDKYGHTSLHIASAKGDLKEIQVLLKAAAYAHIPEESLLSLVDRYGNTPLHQAAQSGSAPAVEELLKAAARVGKKFAQELLKKANDGRKTPLHKAAESGSAATIKVLLNVLEDDKQTINTIFRMDDVREQTPLALATSSGNGKSVELLLNAIKDNRTLVIDLFHKQTMHGYTLLHLAAQQDTDQAINILLNVLKDLKIPAIDVLDMPDRKERTPVNIAGFNMRTHGKSQTFLALEQFFKNVNRETGLWEANENASS